MKSIQSAAASFFVATVSVLTVVSVLGVWDVFGKDVISKSFQTIGLLAIVAIVVMIAGKFMEKHSEAVLGVPQDMPSPVWKSVRTVTLTVIVIAGSLLALLGVLAIWDVLTNEEVLNKSLSSLAILAFGAFVVVITSLHMEGKINKDHKGLTVGGVLLALLGLWIMTSLVGFVRYL